MEREPLSDRRFERARHRLIETLRERGIDDLEVLRAFDVVPRHLFLPPAVAHRAYRDAPLPIGYGQTASQPSLIALYLQLLRLGPSKRVLEVGTGTGFQTALLSRLAGQVYSIERVRELSVRARAVLDQLCPGNVALLVGDGTIGWTRFSPYDAILVAAAAPAPPPALVEQLAPGGRMLVPVGDRTEQRLVLLCRTDSGVEAEQIMKCTFVPLIGQFGWRR